MVESPSKSKIPLACVVLAAGQGTRMRSELPKVLHMIAGLPMIGHVLTVCAELLPDRIVVVTAPHSAKLQEAVVPNRCVIQSKPLGTGDAVKAAGVELANFKGNILVLCGDTPLITATTLQKMLAVCDAKNAAVVVAGFRTSNPAAYGRLVQNSAGGLTAIIEASEATPTQREITLCNGGIMLFSSEKIWDLIDGLHNQNSKNEYYLTDTVALAVNAGLTCEIAEMEAEEVLGINTRIELAQAESIMQWRLRERAMLKGVTLADPSTVYFSFDTKLGTDVVIGPNVVFGTGVEIGNKVSIRAFCHLEQTRVEDSAIVGPFSRLRPGTVVGSGAHIGNFVEIKNTEIGRGAKVNHLSYIGDAYVGPKANIGAGVITCNYDGFRKFHTHIGAEAFVGSNSSLVAPVKIGEGAYVGAGSVITMEVQPHTLAVARGRQSNVDGWARRFREEKIKAPNE